MNNKMTIPATRSFTRKSLATLASALVAGALCTTGCLTQNVDSGSSVTPSGSSVTLSGFPSSVSATPGSPAVINGTVESGSALDSVVFEVLDPSGARMDRVRVLPGGKTSYAVKDQTYSFPATTCNGNYKARVTGYAGTASKSVEIPITLGGAQDCSNPPVATAVTVTSGLSMGSQNNATLGSSIDLDAPSVMLLATAKDNAAIVDLVYFNSFASSSDKLVSPSWAKDNWDLMTGWSVYNQTRFEMAPPNILFTDIKTTQQLAALWDASAVTSTSLEVLQGDILIAQTDKGKIVLIEILSQVAGDTGKIQIRVAK